MKCIIVDDEPIARRGLKRLVTGNPSLELAAEFGEAEDALEFVKNNDIDLTFLDIEMPGMNGMELARKLPENCAVIFTTAYSNYAIEGYDVEALDYLLKPVNPRRFEKAVEKAMRYKELLQHERQVETSRPNPDFIVVKSDRRYLRVQISDILYIEGLKDYVIINLRDKKIVTRMTIKGIQETLPSDKFLRVNKSYVVNISAIDAFDNNDVVIGTTEIAIGPSFREDVLNRLLK